MVTLTFYGAAGSVTGSKTLLTTPKKKILVDCGLFQGLKSLRQKNREPFPIEASDIEAVILTHAHIDHSGYLPVLVRQGFRGPIYGSPPTLELLRILLLDTARIQEEEAEDANQQGYSKHNPALPLFTVEEAIQCFSLFKACAPDKTIELDAMHHFRLIPNGHILGSCALLFSYGTQQIAFSGDLGRAHDPLFLPPASIGGCDALVLESTYGDRIHPQEPTSQILSEIICDTIQRGGNVLLSCFALGRAQELIYLINELKHSHKIPPVPVYLDSPMAIDISELLCRFPDWHKLSLDQCLKMFEQVIMIRDIRSTRENMASGKRKIILAGSGMLTGGRMLEYLKTQLEDDRNALILTGYQAEGTRGRSLIEGTDTLKIKGWLYPVKARIFHLKGLSAHADQQELIQWVQNMYPKPKRIFLNHGEGESLALMAENLNKTGPYEVVLPELGHSYAAV